MLTSEQERIIEALLSTAIDEHRVSVAEWSGNFGGHEAIREGWVEFDEDTPIEVCLHCDHINEAQFMLTEASEA